MKKLCTLLWIFLLSTSFVAASEKNGFKINGDIRIREQYENRASKVVRTRERIRFRLGINKQVEDSVSIAAGLATGDENSRSTNQTLNNFETYDIRLDYAYLDYTGIENMKIRLGKTKSLIWRPSDLLWDSDINPDGLSVQYKNNDNFFVNFGGYTLSEEKYSQKDTRIFYIQPGLTFSTKDVGKSKIAVGYYTFNHVKSVSNKWIKPFTFSYQLVKKNTYTVFAEYVSNSDTSTNNNGYIFGISCGHTKIKNKAQWNTTLSYRYLETDAWYDQLPDSDAYGGKTNIKGLEFIANYGLTKKLVAGLSIYSTDTIKGDSDEEILVQTDLKLKF